MNPAGPMRVFHCAKSEFCSPAVLQEEFPVQGFAQGLADGDDDQHQSEHNARDQKSVSWIWNVRLIRNSMSTARPPPRISIPP